MEAIKYKKLCVVAEFHVSAGTSGLRMVPCLSRENICSVCNTGQQIHAAVENRDEFLRCGVVAFEEKDNFCTNYRTLVG